MTDSRIRAVVVALSLTALCVLLAPSGGLGPDVPDRPTSAAPDRPTGAPDTSGTRRPIAAPDPAPWTAPVGRWFDYHVEARTSFGPRAGSDERWLELDGDLRITVVARGEAGVVVEYRFSRLDTRRDGQTAGPGARTLRPFRQLRDPAGRALGYRFEPDVSAYDQRLAAGFGAALGFVDPGDGGTLVETVATVQGAATVRFERHGTTIERRLLALADRAAIVDGKGRAELGSTGWLDSVELEDHVEITLAEVGLRVCSAFRLRATSLADGWTPVTAEHDTIDRDAFGPPRSDRPSVDVRQQIASARQRTVDGCSGAGLCRDVADASREGDARALIRACRRLRQLLRGDANALHDVEVALAALSDPDARAALLGAVASAGTPESMRMLARCVDDADPSVRLAALRAGFQVADPSAELRFALERVLDAPGQVDDHTDIAVLVLGAWSRASASQGESSFQALIARRPTDARDRHVWLSALGNSGRGEVVDVVGPYLSDSSPTVRAAAVGALRNVATEPATAALLAGLRDPDPRVCGAAVRALCADGSGVRSQRLVEDVASMADQALGGRVVDRVAELAERSAAARAVLSELAARGRAPRPLARGRNR